MDGDVSFRQHSSDIPPAELARFLTCDRYFNAVRFDADCNILRLQKSSVEFGRRSDGIPVLLVRAAATGWSSISPMTSPPSTEMNIFPAPSITDRIWRLRFSRRIRGRMGGGVSMR